jgi:hypothetical protein
LFLLERLAEKSVQVSHAEERPSLNDSFDYRGIQMRQCEQIFLGGDVWVNQALLASDLTLDTCSETRYECERCDDGECE